MPITSSHPLSRRPRRTAGAALRSRATFFKEFIKSPGSVAAVAPSSPRLAAAMLSGIDFSRVRTIVEYGPGTGAFTRAVLARTSPKWFAAGGRFIAIEFNQNLAGLLARHHPEVTVVHDSAANVEAICASRGIKPGEVDCVISGLGWPSFPDELRTQVLEATARVLRPRGEQAGPGGSGGEFRTFGYHVGLLMRGAWHFRSEVRRLFPEVHIGRVVWGNMPPAFVYRCVK